MMFFGAPSLDAKICPLPQMVSSYNPTLYKPFTWYEFKKAAYSQRLAGRRLDLFTYNYNQNSERLKQGHFHPTMNGASSHKNDAC